MITISRTTGMLLILLLVLQACSMPTPETPAADAHDHDHGTDTANAEVSLTPEQFAALAIPFVSPEWRTMEGSIRLTGRVMTSPVSKAQVTSPITAKVVDVLVDEGAAVTKGQPLVAFADPGFFKLQEEYLSARAQRTQAVAELERQRTLLAGDATARKSAEQAEARASELQARVGALEGTLRMLGVDPASLRPDALHERFLVRSPMAGRVNGIRVFLGATVEPTTVLLEVIDLHHFHVHLNAYERDLPLLREGVRFPFQVMNLPGGRFEGELFSIGRTFDDDGRTIPLHAHVDVGSEQLVEGMSVVAEIPLGAERQLTVPATALARSGDRAYVYVDEGKAEGAHHFRQVEVRAGVTSDGWVAVTPFAPLDSLARIAGDKAFYLRNSLSDLSHDH
jgi:cobalt-zinc-cadmium efflux system membrane fusion protein